MVDVSNVPNPFVGATSRDNHQMIKMAVGDPIARLLESVNFLLDLHLIYEKHTHEGMFNVFYGM